jgi:hypothetical protein
MIYMQREWCKYTPVLVIPSEARNLGFAYTTTAA